MISLLGGNEDLPAALRAVPPAAPRPKGTVHIVLGDRRNVRWWGVSLMTVVALATVSGCADGQDGADQVGVAAYSAVIDDFVPPVPSDESRPVVYVASLDADPFPLGDQIAMIAAVEESYDLRFVDDFTDAVDDEESEAPLREDEVLLGIGTVSGAVPHVVRVEVYGASGLIDAYKVTLEVRDGEWRVETTESINPQVLGSDE